MRLLIEISSVFRLRHLKQHDNAGDVDPTIIRCCTGAALLIEWVK